MKRGMRSTVILLAGILISAAVALNAMAETATANHGIGEIYTFGDSMSDGGAGLKLIGAICADPTLGALTCGGQKQLVTLSDKFYQHNHFSDGPTAVEVMMHLMGKKSEVGARLDKVGVGSFQFPLAKPLKAIGNNYSIAGATAARRESGTRSLFDLESQVSAFEANHEASLKSTDLALFLIGAVDIFEAKSSADIDAAIKGIDLGVERMKAKGAGSIYLVQYPDLTTFPKYASWPVSQKKTMVGNVQYFNKEMLKLRQKHHASTGALGTPVRVHVFDIWAAYNYIRQQLDGQGVNISTACASVPSLEEVARTFRESHGPTITIDATFNVKNGCKNIGDSANWLFFDDVHPSKLGHQLLGQALYDFIVESETNTCALNQWGKGWPEKQLGLDGSIYAGRGDYFRLVPLALGGHIHGHLPSGDRHRQHWENLGPSLDGDLCASAWRVRAYERNAVH